MNAGQMKVAFISNLLTPHQIPFCNEMNRLCAEFTFFQVEENGDEWTSKGERIYRKDYSYLYQFAKSPECLKTIMDADVVLIGSCDLSLVTERLKAGKLVVVYLERFYKKGITIKNFIRCIGGTYIHHGRFQKYNVNLLCAGAYCAGDAAVFGNYRNRTYKWGYFPKLEDYRADIEKIPNQIIWVGRLIDWKHADHAVKAAADLVKDHPDVILKIYGDGSEKKGIRTLVKHLHLENNIFIMGEAPAEDVKQEMKRSAIFLATSDYQEGWGAVLNEAMNCRCAVVASHAAGSTPFMIRNGENGYVYESGNIRQLTDLCRVLLDDPKLRKKLSDNALDTIVRTWNPQEAAKRFVALSEALLAGEKTPYQDGPCSIAYPIRQREMYSYISKK